MKLSDKSANRTSFHNTVIRTTVNKLTEAIGAPQNEDNTGEDKINFQWVCETEDGYVVTIYDWKEYRELNLDEEIEFHIGGFSVNQTQVALADLREILNKK